MHALHMFVSLYFFDQGGQMMKKAYFFVMFPLILTMFSACGSAGGDVRDNADETKTIRIGFTPGPYSNQVKKGIEPSLKEKGYTVEIVEFTNGNEVNFALAEGSIDADIYQHTAYFENFVEENNLDLTETIKVPTAPMGIYSDKYKSLEGIDKKKTYSIAIPNDPPNIARALRILEEAKFVQLKDDFEPLTVSTRDIKKYHVKMKFVEVEQAQLARVIKDVDFALVNGNYILASGRELSQSLLLEDPPFEYQNLIAVRTEDKDKQFVKDLLAAYKTDRFQKLIETDPEFKGFWHPDYFK